MCGCEFCISAKIIHSSLLSWCDGYLKKLKDKSQNAQIRRSGEKSHNIYETYKNTVMPHGHHIYAKASDMEKETICEYLQSDHALPQTNLNSTTPSHQRHAVFHSFYLMTANRMLLLILYTANI